MFTRSHVPLVVRNRGHDGAAVRTMLPANSERTYVITGTVAREPELPLAHSATVETPANVMEIDSADNSASDATDVGVFADGFEALPAGG